MALKFTQHEIESKVAAVLEYGDVKKIVDVSGLGYSLVDQQLNPNDERKSYIVGALEILCAADEVSAKKGEAIWQIMTQTRELSKPAKQTSTCLNLATSKLNTEVAEYLAAKLQGKPFAEQMKEFLDIEAQMAVVKKALIDEFNRLNDEPQTKSANLKVVK